MAYEKNNSYLLYVTLNVDFVWAKINLRYIPLYINNKRSIFKHHKTNKIKYNKILNTRKKNSTNLIVKISEFLFKHIWPKFNSCLLFQLQVWILIFFK